MASLLDQLYFQNPWAENGLLGPIGSMYAPEMTPQMNGGFLPQGGLNPSAATAQFMTPQVPQTAQQPQMPPNATPVAAPVLNTANPETSFGDRISNGLNNNPYLLMGLGAGIMQGGLGRGLETGAKFGLMDQQQQARTQAARLQQTQLQNNYTFLRNRGYDDATAKTIALNPDLMKQIATDLVPTGAAPPTTEIELPNGLKQKAQWDRQSRQWVPINLDQTTAPNAQQQQATPDLMTPAPPPPAGVNVPEYMKKQADKIVENQQEARTKADGAMEFLGRSQQLRKMLDSASPDIFGFWGNSTPARTIRQAGSGLFEKDAQNSRQSDELKAMFGDLSSSLLKARFGSANLSDADRKAAEALVGGLDATDPKSAVKILENLEKQELAKVQDAVKRGLISPQQAAPFLQQMQAPQQPAPQQQLRGPSRDDILREMQRRKQSNNQPMMPQLSFPNGV